MFFVLSKILMFLIQPVIWILAVFIYGLFTKNAKRKKRSFLAALIMLLFFSNSFILDEVMRSWEVDAVAWEKVDGVYDYGIVLGGMISYDKEYDRINFLRSSDRLMQTIELYNRGKIKKIFLSGGSGDLLDPDFKESLHIKKYLVRMGIPEEDILEESTSRNTHENAICSAEILLKNNNNPRCLLITSAFHMRRALGCFENEGLIVDPFVTDRYAGPRKFEFSHLILPDIEAMGVWTLLIHEITGYVVYDISGYL